MITFRGCSWLVWLSYHCCVSVSPVGWVGRELCFHSCLFLGKLSQSFSFCCTELQEISSCDFVEIFFFFFFFKPWWHRTKLWKPFIITVGLCLQAIWSLYNPSESCVQILGTKSNRFPVGVGLHQGCPLSQSPFGISWAGSQVDIARRVSSEWSFCRPLYSVTNSRHRAKRLGWGSVPASPRS